MTHKKESGKRREGRILGGGKKQNRHRGVERAAV